MSLISPCYLPYSTGSKLSLTGTVVLTVSGWTVPWNSQRQRWGCSLRRKKRRDWIPCGGQFIQQTTFKTNTSLVGRIAKRVLISATKNAERVHFETCLWPVSMKYTGVTCVAVFPVSFKQRGKKWGTGCVPHPRPFLALSHVTCASLALREAVTRNEQLPCICVTFHD